MNVHKAGAAVAVATTDEILNIPVEGFEEAGIAIKNNGANALDAFEVWAKFSKDGPAVLVANQATDFSTPKYPIRRADALVTLAAGATGVLFMAVSGIHTLILKASIATAAGTVDIDAQIT